MVLPVVRLCLRRLYVVLTVVLVTAALMYIFLDAQTAMMHGRDSVGSHEALRGLSGKGRDSVVADIWAFLDDNDDDDSTDGDDDSLNGEEIHVADDDDDDDDDDDADDEGDNNNNNNDDGETEIENAGNGGGVPAKKEGEKISVDKAYNFRNNTARQTEQQVRNILMRLKRIHDVHVPHVKKSAKVVILTYMRSGSTLTGDLFQHHPDVFYVFEPLWKTMKNYNNRTEYIGFLDGQGEEKHRTPDLFWRRDSPSTSILRNVLNCRFNELDIGTLRMHHYATSQCTTDYNECLKVYRRSLVSIRVCFPLLQQPCSRSKVTVVKSIRYTIEQLQDLMTSDPDVKAIHLVRDPRGTFLSQYRVGKIKRDTNSSTKFGEFCERVYADLKNALKLPQKFKDRILTVRYEDIVQYPIASAKYMHDFVGLQLTEAIKEYIWSITYAGLKNKPEICRMLCTVRENSTITAYRWRTRLPYSLVQMVDTVCAQVYEPLGYRPFKDMNDWYTSPQTSSTKPDFGAVLKQSLNVMSLKKLEEMPESKIRYETKLKQDIN